MAGQGIDVPTTTIETGAMSIITIRVHISLSTNLQISEISGRRIHQQSMCIMFSPSLIATMVRGNFFGYLGHEMAIW